MYGIQLNLYNFCFQEIYPTGTFAGVCGVWNVPFPWKHFKKRGWVQAAVQVLSLAVRFMEKVIPGYRKCEQNFEEDYIGMRLPYILFWCWNCVKF